MRQQVPDRYRPLGGAGREASVGTDRACDYAGIGIGLDVVADRVVERQLAFLHEHHDGGRSDRLRHRGDAEDRVGCHRQPAGDVALTVGRHVDHTLFVGDESD